MARKREKVFILDQGKAKRTAIIDFLNLKSPHRDSSLKTRNRFLQHHRAKLS